MNRSPETLFRLLMVGVSLVFASFLVGFGRLVIRDLPKAGPSVQLEDFLDEGKLREIEDRTTEARTALTDWQRTQQTARQNAQQARTAYNREQEVFRNWVATRSATADQAQNPELLSRTRRLDSLKAAQGTAELEAERIDREELKARQNLDKLEAAAATLRKDANAPFQAAQRQQELAVFGIRLLFTLPLLALSVFLWRKKRGDRYWPLWRGFVWFSLVAFFVELVPYLPSYGGYVRYIVGIVLTALAGHYGVVWMQNYLARRKAAEKEAEIIRRTTMDRDAALRKLAANLCPTCDRPIPQLNGQTPTFCVHCGLRLFVECDHCHSRMSSFYAHCGSCGQTLGSATAPAMSDAPPVLNKIDSQ